MLKIRSSVEPDVQTMIDRQEKRLTVEVMLPGVQTDTIMLKVNTCSVFIQASAIHAFYAKYILLHHDVIHHRARAVLIRDRLRVVIPLRG